MKTIAVFNWKRHLPNDDEVQADPQTCYSNDFGEQWAYQACQPIAVSLLEAFHKRGFATNTDTPYFGEHAWNFTVRLGPQDYSILIMWVPRGLGYDGFAVQPTMRRGCLPSLLFSHPDESVLQPICALLRDVLESHSQVANLEWVDDVDELW